MTRLGYYYLYPLNKRYSFLPQLKRAAAKKQKTRSKKSDDDQASQPIQWLTYEQKPSRPHKYPLIIACTNGKLFVCPSTIAGRGVRFISVNLHCRPCFQSVCLGHLCTIGLFYTVTRSSGVVYYYIYAVLCAWVQYMNELELFLFSCCNRRNGVRTHVVSLFDGPKMTAEKSYTETCRGSIVCVSMRLMTRCPVRGGVHTRRLCGVTFVHESN